MSTQQYRLRPLQPQDVQRCAELEAILFPGDDPWSADAFLAELANPNNFYLAVEQAGTAGPENTPAHAPIVGYAGLSLLGPVADPEFEIHTIGVHPAVQRQGLGRLLMDNLMAVADHYNGPVFLEVRTDNAPAIALYEAYGFIQTGIRKNYYQPSGADAFTMMRPATKDYT